MWVKMSNTNFILRSCGFFLGSFKKRERERERRNYCKKKEKGKREWKREREDKRPIIKEW